MPELFAGLTKLAASADTLGARVPSLLLAFASLLLAFRLAATFGRVEGVFQYEGCAAD